MKLRIAAFVALMAIALPADAKKKPELTPMELQALQSHEYETSKEVLFASVVSVFQDLGYQLENADMPSGFITAASATVNKTGLLEALAQVSASGNTRATAFVEAMPNGMARVRLNFLNSKQSSGRFGQGGKEDKPILDPATYQTAWNKIDQALFERAALSGPARPPAAAAPPAAGATPPATSVPPTTGVSPR